MKGKILSTAVAVFRDERVNADGQLQNDPLSPFPPLAEMEDFWITEPSHQPYKCSH